MSSIKLYDIVEVLVDKSFNCPKGFVKKGSIGTVVDIAKNSKGELGYIVEFEGDVYDLKPSEIQIVK